MKEANTFNKYINPHVKQEYWSDATINAHELRPTDACIQEADYMGKVWQQFFEFIKANISQCRTYQHQEYEEILEGFKQLS